MKLENIDIGDSIPSFFREGKVEYWNRYAAVNDEFADHHWSDEVAQSEGFEKAFAMAPLEQAYMHNTIREWLGDDLRILLVNIRLRSPFVRDGRLEISGKILKKSFFENEYFFEAELNAKDEKDNLIATGLVSFSYPFLEEK